jgi:uncharacterized membrane protein YeaQ/YmgE (transglycosylase-associated protein family)
MTLDIAGALCFGLVIGWVTYRTLSRTATATVLSDISTVIGAVGGGAVTKLFSDSSLFASYAIGLAVGFFAYLLLYALMNGKHKTGAIMGG